MAIAQHPTNVVPIGGATLDRQLEELATLRDLSRRIDQLDGAIATMARQRDSLQAQVDELLNRRVPRA